MTSLGSGAGAEKSKFLHGAKVRMADVAVDHGSGLGPTKVSSEASAFTTVFDRPHPGGRCGDRGGGRGGVPEEYGCGAEEGGRIRNLQWPGTARDGDLARSDRKRVEIFEIVVEASGRPKYQDESVKTPKQGYEKKAPWHARLP